MIYVPEKRGRPFIIFMCAVRKPYFFVIKSIGNDKMCDVIQKLYNHLLGVSKKDEPHRPRPILVYADQSR